MKTSINSFRNDSFRIILLWYHVATGMNSFLNKTHHVDFMYKAPKSFIPRASRSALLPEHYKRYAATETAYFLPLSNPVILGCLWQLISIIGMSLTRNYMSKDKDVRKNKDLLGW